MDKKLFFILLFLLINVLTLVSTQGLNQDDNQNTTDPPKPDPTTTPSPQTPATTTTTPQPDPPTPPPPIASTQPTTTTSASVVTTPQIIITPVKTTTTKHVTTVKTVTTQKAVKQTTIVKKYPQETFVNYYQSTNKNEYDHDVSLIIYIISAAVCTVLAGAATLIIYKKGFGEEAPASSRTWDNSFEDDGYRNKSTISRNTLTPSIRNTTLNSPSSNPSTSQYH